MSYTTKQRNEIYKKALEALPYNVLLGRGLCYAIKSAGGRDGAYFDHTRAELFPELDLFTPSEDVAYWFDGRELQARQIILDFCILMTEK